MIELCGGGGTRLHDGVACCGRRELAVSSAVRLALLFGVSVLGCGAPEDLHDTGELTLDHVAGVGACAPGCSSYTFGTLPEDSAAGAAFALRNEGGEAISIEVSLDEDTDAAFTIEEPFAAER